MFKYILFNFILISTLSIDTQKISLLCVMKKIRTQIRIYKQN